MSKISMGPTNNFCPQTLFLYGTYKEDGTPNFGLFCWFSYYWDSELGGMCCIGGEKLTKDRIKATKVFSANLVNEELLAVADKLGNSNGYEVDKSALVEVEKGAVLDVPVLKKSPVVFELEVVESLPKDDGEVFLCKMRNVLMEDYLCDESKSEIERVGLAKPVRTTCTTYFGWDGTPLGAWGEPSGSDVDLSQP